MDINLSKTLPIDLQKKSEAVGIQLAKHGIRQAPTMRVGIALDISGSMYHIISSGMLQNAFNQMMGVSVQFDDNGELDVFKFDTRCEYVGTSKPEAGDYDQYIRNNKITDRGGTSYSPIVKAARDFFFKPKGGFLGGMFSKGGNYEDDTPVLMLILTDGEPGDRQETLKAMQDTASMPIYYHMVGIGGTRDDFSTIAWLADELPNVGEVYLPRLDMSDEEIYEQLICDELVGFVANFSTPVARARG